MPNKKRGLRTVELDIQQLIESIGLSVSEAQQTIENHSIKRFFGFFDNEAVCNSADGDVSAAPPSMTPKKVGFMLPRSDDMSVEENKPIPLPALVHHRQVSLDKVTVNIKTRLRADSDQRVMTDMSSAPPKKGKADEDANDDTYGEINLEFNVRDSAEGVSRVVQDMIKTI